MLKALKGRLTSATCRSFSKFPDAQTQERLRSAGWEFRVIEGPGDDVLAIIHPDGQDVDGYGSPYYEPGYDRRSKEQEKLYQASCKKRWHDFALACADHPDAPRRKAKPRPAEKAPAAAAKPAAPASISFTFQL
jgi:hypothetical protein